MVENITIKKLFYMKKRVYIAFVLVLTIMALAVVGTIVFRERSKDKINETIGTVNGVPLSTKYFYSVLNKKSAEIHSYFNSKYGVNDNKNFWTTSYDGEIPLEVAKKKALDDCIRVLVQQELAKKNNIIDDISYEKIVKDCEIENKKRKQDLAKGKLIYGPIEYSVDNYFAYIFSNMVINLKTKLGDNDLKLEEKAVKQIYEADKDSLYKLTSITINKISFPILNDSSDVDPVKKVEAKTKIDEILKRISTGEKFEELAVNFNKDGTVEEQIFNSASERIDSRNNPELRGLAEKMSTGEISDILELENSLNLVKCVEYKVEGFKEFDEVKENIKLKYIDAKYEEYIDKLSKEAKVEIDQKAYSHIKMT